jgi:adenylosuccinate synthase
MSVNVIVGLQWGDEGKGKVVDWLAQSADMVIRFQGGCNAGHTVIVGDETYKLHLIPSGILNPNTICVLGAEVVIDMEVLLNEINGLKSRGISVENLYISPYAHVTMPYHKQIDLAEEKKRGSNAIGTTGKGIGPTYTDKVKRNGIRLIDIEDEDEFSTLYFTKFIDYGAYDSVSAADSYSKIINLYKELKPYVRDATKLVYDYKKAYKTIIMEGAQGTMLDINSIDYPYVTSSHTVSGAACLGTGIAPMDVTDVTGVAKIYATRVGSGAFPTELENNGVDSLGHILCVTGKEVGTTTGRIRRCGWLDLVLLKNAVMANGVSKLALMKLDVLDGFSEINFCINYDDKGEPIYQTFKGWEKSPINGEQLSEEINTVISFIEEYLNVGVYYLSTGPERDKTFRI